MEQRAVPETAVDPGELVTERLEAEITTLAAHLTAAECRFLLLVGEFDRREAFLAWGCRTAAFWLSWKCGIDIRSAQEKLRVARALHTCPYIVAAFAAGRLSYSKVRAITRIVTPENEEELVSLALHATAAQVERAVRAYRGVLSREEENAWAVERRVSRGHQVEWDDELGLLCGRYRLTPEDGEVWMKGLDAAAEQLRNANPDLGYSASFADALVVLAESYLAHGPAARAGGDRYLAMINLDADVLALRRP